MSVVVIDKLTKRYGRRIGIDRVTLQVAQGDIFGFLGPNGAGKTTAIRVLLGLLRPTAGSARIFGSDCWRSSRRIKQEVGYLPGDLRLYPQRTGNDLLRICGAIRRRDLRSPGQTLAELFSLDLNVTVRRMSRGMRQKLGLILALAHRPQLLILDEPTASLDPLMQERLIEFLRGLAGEGHTIFFSSHSLSEVERLCDRVAIVRDGRLVADETLQSLRDNARRVVTIRWHTDDGDLQAPPFLDVHHRDDHLWEASLRGDVTLLLEWLRDRPVADFTVGHPDLDSLFRQYYLKEAARS